MTLITRFCATFLLIAITLPYVAAHPGHSGPSDCTSEEFWYKEKDTCIKHGVPRSAPPPPAEKQCPPAGWSWSDKHGCCLPHHPPPPSPPPPQCANGWEWSPATFCCQKPHHPFYPQPPPPKPSGGYQGHSGWKRSLPKSRATQLCPTGLSACPIPGASGLTGDFECLDTAHELESCGGCASTGEGQDCTAIKGAWNVGCDRGSCAVYTCAGGFKLADDGKSCISL